MNLEEAVKGMLVTEASKGEKQITAILMSIDAGATNMLASWDDGADVSKKDIDSMSKNLDKLKKLIK